MTKRKTKSEVEEIESSLKSGNNREPGSSDTEEVGINPIYQGLKERLTETQTNIDLQEARIEELKRQIGSDNARLKTIPKEQEEYSRLTRGRDVYQRLYDSLTNKLESARVSKEMEEADKGESFRVLDPAVLPAKPIEPNRVQIILFGFFPITFHDLRSANGDFSIFTLGQFDKAGFNIYNFDIRARYRKADRSDFSLLGIGRISADDGCGFT